VNAPQRAGLPDIQSLVDSRSVAIDEVGIKGVRYPMAVLARGEAVATVATFSMTVALPASTKGTHMSRFIEILEAHRAPLDPAGFRSMVLAMLKRLDARAGTVEAESEVRRQPEVDERALCRRDCRSVPVVGEHPLRRRSAVVEDRLALELQFDGAVHALHGPHEDVRRVVIGRRAPDGSDTPSD